jgi:thioredoxin-related protein
MKYLIIGIIVSLGLNAVAQDSALVWEVDVKKAADIAIAEKKPLFLFYTGSDWCGVCKKLQNEVFSQPQFIKWAKKNVIPVELDYPRNKEPDPRFVEINSTMKEMFGITGFPTIVFAAPSKNKNGLYYTRIGSIGYMSGGPDVWLNAASQYLPSQK